MTWLDDVQEFCEFYNIPLAYFVDTLYEPKVIPMIRGKAFEFTVLLKLKNILPEEEFEVTKESMNAQIDSHDIDVAVLHKPTNITISVECKLAGKGTYRYVKKDNRHLLRVKCMRSRTLGESMIAQQSTKLGLDPKLLKIHNDSYLPEDFDVVLTSIANVFYITREDGIFDWKPSQQEVKFLKNILPESTEVSLKNDTFNTMYLAVSYDLAVREENETECPRQKCTNKQSCGFIPNYPYIIFDNHQRQPEHPWYPIQDAVSFFRNVAKRKLELS